MFRSLPEMARGKPTPPKILRASSGPCLYGLSKGGCIPKIIDITGQTFGKLTVLGYAGRGLRRSSLWNVRCDCGTEKATTSLNLRHGKSRSCGGCNFKHGATRHGLVTREYRIWHSMKFRCFSPNATHYHSYGGRGITVCQRWVDNFQNFLDDMGMPPTPKHSIDRIDNDGHYEPQNCRWATALEQGQNTRTNRHVTINGETMILADAIRRFMAGKRGTVQSRISRGWSVERALFTPT